MKQIIKKAIIIILVAVMSFSLVGFKSSKDNLLEFNGIPFGTTQKEVMPKIEKILKKQKYKGEVEEVIDDKFLYYRTTIYDKFRDVKIDDYIADYFTLEFVTDDTEKDITESKFYAASYRINYTAQYQANEIVEFYKKKFTKTYGEPTRESEDGKTIIWYTDDLDTASCSISIIDKDKTILLYFCEEKILREYTVETYKEKTK